MLKLLSVCFSLIVILMVKPANLSSQAIQYTMPDEHEIHEGTWLQWPHQYTYGMAYRNAMDPIWLDMTAALVTGEKVHIVAYNETERNRITGLLNAASIPLANIDFYIHQNDDVWVRDNGPIFVYDQNNNLALTDWGFNGWGNDAPYAKCDVIPQGISNDIAVPRIDLSAMVLEGGAFEHDGHGTFMATRSSVTHSSRNPGLTEAQIETYLTVNLGFTKFIWLDGVYGQDITDMHIDGVMKFIPGNRIVTMSQADLLEWGVPQNDINTLYAATNGNNIAYDFVQVPLTQNNVVTTAGQNLGFPGCYINYYVGNSVVLVPNYNDPNDATANAIIQNLYPNRTVVGIDVRDLYEYGGMVHCVTQQQPPLINTTGIIPSQEKGIELGQNYPNPSTGLTNIDVSLKQESTISLELIDLSGKRILKTFRKEYPAGTHTIPVSTEGLSQGIYFYTLFVNRIPIGTKRMTVIK